MLRTHRYPSGPAIPACAAPRSEPAFRCDQCCSGSYATSRLHISALDFDVQPFGCASKVTPQVHVFVQVRDQIAVAVERQGGPPGAEEAPANVALGCLAPARMIHLRIDVRIEAIFVRRRLFPRGPRLAPRKIYFDEKQKKQETIL